MQAGAAVADLCAGDERQPSRKPVVDAAPPVHCATFSYTLQSS